MLKKLFGRMAFLIFVTEREQRDSARCDVRGLSYFCPETKVPKILRSKGEMARLGRSYIFETKASEIPPFFCSQTPLTSLLRRGGLLLSFAVVLFVFDLHYCYSQQAEALI